MTDMDDDYEYPPPVQQPTPPTQRELRQDVLENHPSAASQAHRHQDTAEDPAHDEAYRWPEERAERHHPEPTMASREVTDNIVDGQIRDAINAIPEEPRHSERDFLDQRDAADEERAAGPWASGYDEDDGAGDALAQARHDAIMDRLAAQQEVEVREADPDLARLQDARDTQAAAGQWDLADALDRLFQSQRDRAALDADLPAPRGPADQRQLEDQR